MPGFAVKGNEQLAHKENMMAQLPKLTKAQQEAWARILEWYAQEDRKEAFISGKARWGVSPSAVPAGKNTLDALRDKGLLVYAPRKGYQPLHYTIHPDYLPASEPAAEPESEPVAVDAPRFNVGDKVTPLKGKWEGNICTVVDVFVDLYGIMRVMVNNDAFNWRGAFSYKELELVKHAASEPATDDRPTTDEARLIDSVNEARMERDMARNEADSLRGQLDSLRVRFAEMEAVAVEDGADLEATAVREAHLATRVAELEAENAGLYEQVEKLNDEAENMSAYIVLVEQARDFWKRKSNPTYDSLKAVSDKQDEVIAALETALDLEKNENEKLRAAVERIERKSRMAWNIYSLSYTEDSDYGDFLEIRNIAAKALGLES